MYSFPTNITSSRKVFLLNPVYEKQRRCPVAPRQKWVATRKQRQPHPFFRQFQMLVRQKWEENDEADSSFSTGSKWEAAFAHKNSIMKPIFVFNYSVMWLRPILQQHGHLFQYLSLDCNQTEKVISWLLPVHYIASEGNVDSSCTVHHLLYIRMMVKIVIDVELTIHYFFV